jgi:hypothetical protein
MDNKVLSEMSVVCSEGAKFATVDHLESNNSIKLKKDKLGQHHYIPTSWVTNIDSGKVTVDRPGNEAKKDWTDTPTIQLN